MTTIYGIPLYESPLAQTIESGKPYAMKPWMHGRAYYKRQVKKLAKRHGPLVYMPAIFRSKHPLTGRVVVFIHPTLMQKLPEALRLLR